MASKDSARQPRLPRNGQHPGAGRRRGLSPNGRRQRHHSRRTLYTTLLLAAATCRASCAALDSPFKAHKRRPSTVCRDMQRHVDLAALPLLLSLSSNTHPCVVSSLTDTRRNGQRSEDQRRITEIATALARNNDMANLVFSIDVQYVDSDVRLDEALRVGERDEGEEAYTIADAYLRDKLVFIWRVGQSCVLKIRIAPRGVTSLPFEQILNVAVKADHTEWTRLPARMVEDGPTEKDLVAVLNPNALRCPRLLSPCPRFGSVDRKYVKILVSVRVALDADVSQTVDLYQTIYARMVARDDRRPLRCLARRWRRAWQNVPQSVRDVAVGVCFVVDALLEISNGRCAFSLVEWSDKNAR